MAHLLEQYALSCGAKIKTPQILETFFPIPFEKYVLIHCGGGMVSKIYEYYSEVVSLIKVPLQKAGYEILQIGGDKDLVANGVFNLCGSTNMHQTAYLIKNASLFIGNDSCNLHIASGYDIPLIGLYGPTTVENHGPYFSSNDKKVLMIGDLKGNKPSYAAYENPKSINTIKPEQIAKNVLSILGIEDKITFETVFVGDTFNQTCLDIVPNFVLPPNIGHNIVPKIRMDFLFDERGLAANLQVRRHIIVTDKEINLSLLKNLGKNIERIFIKINKNSSTDFASNVIKLGIPTILFSEEKDQELGNLKLEFFDYGAILEQRPEDNVKLVEGKNINSSTKFKTNRFFMNDSKIYLSKAHLDKNIPTESFDKNVGQVILDDPKFFEYSQYYYLFNE